MSIDYLGALQAAIIERTEKAKDPDWQWTSEVPFRVSIAFSCVERGDTKGLSTWLQRIDENLIADPTGEYEAAVVDARLLLNSWQQLEAIHGDGALLDYEYWLESSPAEIVGVERIANAKRFQASKNRVAGDPLWALQFG
ncbi:hypothetical protein GOZ90_11475 [Agrobacterium vitis]|uniref:Uncharacterized protein n=1 Tax=Agrobacterium vitis TaxID=373 RepID=A0A6L6VIQ2_AGRVI|nr:hypothetical protein [Agrobacterium vitis]MUZ73302.1 hypothetical protein [Agrobacterium vitis]